MGNSTETSVTPILQDNDTDKTTARQENNTPDNTKNGEGNTEDAVKCISENPNNEPRMDQVQNENGSEKDNPPSNKCQCIPENDMALEKSKTMPVGEPTTDLKATSTTNAEADKSSQNHVLKNDICNQNETENEIQMEGSTKTSIIPQCGGNYDEALCDEKASQESTDEYDSVETMDDAEINQPSDSHCHKKDEGRSVTKTMDNKGLFLLILLF